MKKVLFLFITLLSLTHVYGQTVPVADLMDIKFSVQNGAEDISKKSFKVEKGKGATTPLYDQSIKQYVSHYTKNSSPISTNYYRINYKNDEDFKNKLRKSFTLEVYIKTESDEDVVPVGSMQSGGFGIQQVAKGGAMRMKLGHKPKSYAFIGSTTTYHKIPKYYHIVYTYDGNIAKSYYNGVLKDNVAAGELRFAASSSSHWIGIGGDVSTTTPYVEKAFSGDIALVRMYSKSLSDTEIKALNKQIVDRVNLAEIDVLNNLIESRLQGYAAKETDITKKNQALKFIEEGRKLMQSLSTTAQDINNFSRQVESALGVKTADINSYPKFAVISDVHVGGDNNWNDKITNVIKTLDTDNEPLDALFVVGDITNGGTLAQYQSAKKVFSQMPSSTPIHFCMGNHDWLASSTKSNNYYKNTLGQDQNQYMEIKGYPFILISLDSSNPSNGYYTATRNYLKAALEDADKKYPGKSIFLFIHVPVTNTVYGSRNRGNTSMNDIIKKYPQVVMFSGHSHYSINDERSILQDKYTMVHDGGIAYTRTATDDMDKIKPALSGNFAEGCVVSVGNTGDVIVKRMDFFRNEEIKQPWVIKAPNDGSNFVYTKARNGGEKPTFKATDKPSVKALKSTAFNVTFPQATDDDMVHHYEVTLTDLKGKKIKSSIEFAGIHLNSDKPKFLTTEMSTYAYKGYKVKIVAVDSYGEKSLPIESDLFITPTGYLTVDNLYLTGTVLSGGWTLSKAQKLNPVADRPGVFEWEGPLKVGQFKFILQNTSSKPALSATATRTIKSGTSYDVIITDGSSSKYKFKIAKKTNYKVVVDVNNWTVTVTESSKLRSASSSIEEENNYKSASIELSDNTENYFSIIPRIEGVEVNLKTDITVNSAELIDLSGKIIANVRSKDTSFTLGKNIVPGIYIVKINCPDKVYTQKIIVNNK